ncbi:hypothetical protein BKA66DRAFT_455815, partial [Pyrenochaeta sp. MPI-SDFR-AT-0127]
MRYTGLLALKAASISSASQENATVVIVSSNEMSGGDNRERNLKKVHAWAAIGYNFKL